jgi:hypothetical protein
VSIYCLPQLNDSRETGRASPLARTTRTSLSRSSFECAHSTRRPEQETAEGSTLRINLLASRFECQHDRQRTRGTGQVPTGDVVQHNWVPVVRDLRGLGLRALADRVGQHHAALRRTAGFGVTSRLKNDDDTGRQTQRFDQQYVMVMTHLPVLEASASQDAIALLRNECSQLRPRLEKVHH